MRKQKTENRRTPSPVCPKETAAVNLSENRLPHSFSVPSPPATDAARDHTPDARPPPSECGSVEADAAHPVATGGANRSVRPAFPCLRPVPAASQTGNRLRRIQPRKPSGSRPRHVSLRSKRPDMRANVARQGRRIRTSFLKKRYRNPRRNRPVSNASGIGTTA